MSKKNFLVNGQKQDEIREYIIRPLYTDSHLKKKKSSLYIKETQTFHNIRQQKKIDNKN